MEDDGFIQLMVHMQPRYLLPSRQYFSDTMLPQVYEKMKSVVKQDLAEPNGSIYPLRPTFGPAQNSRKHLFRSPDTGLNKILHVLMQFFTQVIFLAYTLELISLKCSAKCGQSGAYLVVERMVKLKRSIQLYVFDHNDLPNT